MTFIETPERIKNKKCTINPQNKYNKCFQYSITLSLYHAEIKHYPETISKIKPFIDNLNWENINFSPQKQVYQTFEMNNKSIALNTLHIEDQEKISHFYKSDFNKTRERQAILLMIIENEKQYYLAVKRLNVLLKKRLNTVEITVLNCLEIRKLLKTINVNHFHNQNLDEFHSQ